MRILLDESVPRRFGRLLVGHEVTTVAERGWVGMANGDLLAAASGEFDVLVTVDKNLQHQQALDRFAIAVVILDAPTNNLTSLEPMIPRLLEALKGPIQSGLVLRAHLIGAFCARLPTLRARATSIWAAARWPQ